MKFLQCFLICLFILTIAVIPTYADLAESITGVFYLDNGTTTNVINPYPNGTLTGTGFQWNTEPWKSGRDFNDNLECNDSISLGQKDEFAIFQQPFLQTGNRKASMGFWINITNWRAWTVIFADGKTGGQVSMLLDMYNNNSLRFRIDGDSSTTRHYLYDYRFEEHFFVITREQDQWTFYVDGVNISRFNQDSRTTATIGNLTFTNSLASENFCDNDFKMDELNLWNRTLTPTEVTELYNSGQGLFYPFEEAVTGIIDILFQNETGSYKNNFGEGEDFRIFINLTYSNNQTAIPDSLCQVNLTDGIKSYDIIQADFDLCGTACDYEVYTNSVTGMDINSVNDSFHFKACHPQNVNQNIEVNVSCSGSQINFNLTAAEIPLCSESNPDHFFTTDICINEEDVNISLSYSGINIFRKNIADLEYDRTFSIDEMTFSYNATKQLYETDHYHEFYEHGNKSITSYCNNTDITLDANITEQITIVNVLPEIFFNQVLTGSVSQNLTDNIVLEFYDNSTWQFFVSVIDDDLISESYNLTDGNNNTLGSGSDTSSINVNSDKFIDIVNPYRLNVNATDAFGSTVNEVSFWLNDTIFPNIAGFGNNTATINSTYTYNLEFQDENFYSYNITCNNSLTASESGLNVTYYAVDIDVNITADTTCYITFCDAHTNEKLEKDWKITKSNNRKEIRFNEKNMLKYMGSDAVNIDYEIKKDKITFEFDFPDKNNNELKDHIFYYHTSPDSHYFKSSLYPCWIVDNKAQTWLDMVGVENCEVFDETEGIWEITVTTTDKKIKAESIGELNCENAESYIIATEPTEATGERDVLRALSCPTTIIDGMMWFLIIGLFITFFVLNQMYIRFPFVDLVIGFGVIIFGLAATGCNTFFGIIIAVLGAILIVHSAVGWK